MTGCCGLSYDGQRALSSPFITSLVAGSQPFGMRGFFSLMLVSMCLKINPGVFIYLCISFFLSPFQIRSRLSRCCAFLR